MTLNAWRKVLSAPLPGRSVKPRNVGITMVLDKGMNLAETKEWLTTTVNYVDLLKFTFGTSALYPEELLSAKIQLLRAFGVGVFTGGTLLEIAVLQGKTKEFLNRTVELGFNYLEVSDGTISMDLHTRGRIIDLARQLNLRVISEVGKKSPEEGPMTKILRETAGFDLEHGVELVIIEGREAGKGVGVYGPNGEIEESHVEYLMEYIAPQKILWETPLKEQQVEFIKRFGSNANLGNIAPSEVIPLEALRLGLRSDTLHLAPIKKERFLSFLL